MLLPKHGRSLRWRYRLANRRLGPEMLDLVAERFRALSDRARLSLLQELRGGERTVSDLVSATGMGQANVSRHLSTLHAAGLVTRVREGVFVRYALADKDVLKLCDIVCGRLESEVQERRKIVGVR